MVAAFFKKNEKTTPTLGYVLHPDYWDQGLVTEAVKAFISSAAQQLELTHIYATCDQENIGSQRVLEKNEFKKIKEYIDPDFPKGGPRLGFLYRIDFDLENS